MPALPRFPENFLWGVATAAYQIEGGATNDGRGPSIWDTFSHAPGRVRGGVTGDVTCDHYHRWETDLDLMAELGVGAYRFSISWSRVQPPGSGPVNQPGLDFYERLVDALLARGITPMVTLYHWDLPQPLEDGGGWLERGTAERFADFAGIVCDRLGDRVPRWITLNEPFIQMAFGYALGLHAPGRELLLGALPAGHHQLLGHGLAVAALRAAGAREVMLTNNYTPVTAASESQADLAAAAGYDALHNGLFTDPVLLGRYPDLSAFGLDGVPEFVRDGDLEVIGTRLDALGVNYYTPAVIGAAGPGSPLPFTQLPVPAEEHTGFGWPVVPSGLRDLLVGLRDRYGPALPPVYVTENGCSYPDVVGEDGAVRDPQRVAFLDAHLRALHGAIEAGVDVRGYTVWSLLDNFEWAEGFDQRFGLVHVDYDTLARTPKESFAWYRDQIAGGR
jgi:beta-glucosidase